MHFLDILIFVVYFIAILGVGYYFYRKNESDDDYYVGGRNMGSIHIGLSVVATDVGGGFSIGLGGLGFVMGLSGSWLLFTGLVGAWLSAVLLIPKVWPAAHKYRWLTLPQFFGHYFNGRVALMAGLISAIGYLGFTSSQLLAGAKLASATFPSLSLGQGLGIMGVVAVTYTVFGGLKAVIYTDTFQWIVLMVGLIFIGIPMSWYAVGGWEAIRSTIPDGFLRLDMVSGTQLLNWFITIVPIWFVGMTLYQRIYASRSVKSAKKAWYIAGLFEYPVMAFMGVILGLLSRVAADQGLFEFAGFASPENMDEEMGLPLLLRTVLPAGLMGLTLSAYFSAIMSTADSCLIAASGNIQTDIIRPQTLRKYSSVKVSQIITALVGIVALFLATWMTNVLDLMLLSYAFMVSGLFIPVLAALFTKNPSANGAFWAMLLGGGTTLLIQLSSFNLPFGLDPNWGGITVSLISYIVISKLDGNGADRG